MIKNTEDLRQMLLGEIELIQNGKSEPGRAREISKLSNQVISSAKLDLEIAKFRDKINVEPEDKVVLGIERKK